MPQELYWEMAQLNLGIVNHTEAVTVEVESTLEQNIQKGQATDARVKEIKGLISEGRAPGFTEDEFGIVCFKNRICVPEDDKLREEILQEAHDSTYSIHPGSTKMYKDLK